MKKVKIENAGCAIFPSGSIYNVVDHDNVAYVAHSDLLEKILIKDWCKDIESDIETITDEYGVEYDSNTVLFGKNKYKKGISFNKFFSEGYYHNGVKTDDFSQEEYEFFEKYIVENKDRLFVGTCDYSSFKTLVNLLENK